MLEEDFAHITSCKLIDWTRFANATILITGANGFLPAYMAKTLLKLNATLLKSAPCRVLALVRNTKHARQVFAPYLESTLDSALDSTDPTLRPTRIHQDLVLITHDVSSPIHLPYPIHYIIHAASPASPRIYKDAPLSVIYPNVLGTINMLNLARINPVRSLLYFSSGEVYGEFAGEIDENAYGVVDPTSLRSCYAESKRMGENLCIAFASEYGLPVKIVRPFHTYGPGMKLDDGRVFADFVRSVVMGEDIVLTSSGEAKRSFLYLSDATIAYFLILTKGADNEAYNVANEKGIISIKELAQMIANLFPQKGLKVRYEAPSKSYMPSPILSCDVKTTKLNALGFAPQITIEEGFSKTIRSYI